MCPELSSRSMWSCPIATPSTPLSKTDLIVFAVKSLSLEGDDDKEEEGGGGEEEGGGGEEEEEEEDPTNFILISFKRTGTIDPRTRTLWSSSTIALVPPPAATL